MLHFEMKSRRLSAARASSIIPAIDVPQRSARPSYVLQILKVFIHNSAS